MKPGQIFAHWKQVRRGLIWTVDQFNDAELVNMPFESSWPIGKIILHIASAEEGWIQAARGDFSGWPKFGLEKYGDLESIKKLLNRVHVGTVELLDRLETTDLEREVDLPWSVKTRSMSWIIWHVLEHEIHHRGELSLILGLLGRKGLKV
jgi:uncharacterized damage-inducible protein DinB